MSNTPRAHLVQLDIVWEDAQANFHRVEDLIDAVDISPGDLILLPEMFDSGFSLNDEITAVRGLTLAFLVELAEDTGAFVQAGRTLHACHCDKADNRMTTVSPDGSMLCDYTKVHPFSFGRETERFRAGTRVDTWQWPSSQGPVTICPAICYDLRFPELFRLGAKAGAEVFALGTNWPDARQHHWRALAIARAIENQAIFLACNRTGPDPHLSYVGGSIAIDHMGNVLGELGDEQAVLSVELDIAALRAWREKFPALTDMSLVR